MKHEEAYLAGFRDKIAAWYHSVPKALDAGDDVKGYFSKYLEYLDGKITEEEFNKIKNTFVAADQKQPDLPGFDDLFKNSSYKEETEKTAQFAQLAKLLRKAKFEGKQLYYRARTPLDVSYATTGDQAIYNLANTLSPRLGTKYRRNVQFRPHTYKDFSSSTGLSSDLRAVDAREGVEEAITNRGLGTIREPVRPSQHRVIDKLNDYALKQTKKIQAQ